MKISPELYDAISFCAIVAENNDNSLGMYNHSQYSMVQEWLETVEVDDEGQD